MKVTVLRNPNSDWNFQEAEFTGQVPTVARLRDTDSKDIHPIIFFSDSKVDSRYPPVKGTLKFQGERRWFKKTKRLPPEKWYFVPYTVGMKPVSQEAKSIDKTQTDKQFIDAIADGKIGENPLTYSPYQLGANLELTEFARQLNKAKLQSMADVFGSSVKWLIAGLIITVFMLAIVANG